MILNSPAAGTDIGLFSAAEVINYGAIMFSSARYWDSQLREGHRLAAVGGSDNHDALTPPGDVGAIGWPATAVEADQLSVPAILAGLRAGRTFVDLTASRDKMVDFDVEANGASASIGGSLRAAAGATLSVHIRALASQGSMVHLLWDGAESALPPLHLEGSTATATLTSSAGRHWLRLEVRDAAGVSELISSPLYINFPEE